MKLQKKTGSLSNYQHWKKKKVIKGLPRTAKSILRKEKDDIVSQDCSADPCNCTGCSDWD